MGNHKGPTEGGSGGKRGHSSMEHWTDTAELKASSKVHRRMNDRELSRLARLEHSVCDECGSEYQSTRSKMTALCPECSHWLYGYENCEHTMLDGRCNRCFWDGSASKYILSLQNGDRSRD